MSSSFNSRLAFFTQKEGTQTPTNCSSIASDKSKSTSSPVIVGRSSVDSKNRFNLFIIRSIFGIHKIHQVHKFKCQITVTGYRRFFKNGSIIFEQSGHHPLAQLPAKLLRRFPGKLAGQIINCHDGNTALASEGWEFRTTPACHIVDWVGDGSGAKGGRDRPVDITGDIRDHRQSKIRRTDIRDIKQAWRIWIPQYTREQHLTGSVKFQKMALISLQTCIKFLPVKPAVHLSSIVIRRTQNRIHGLLKIIIKKFMSIDL